MRAQLFSRVGGGILVTGSVILGCSDATTADSTGSGGSAVASGGVAPTGGTLGSSGGTTASSTGGIISSSGGLATSGGSPTGGSPTGGSSTGGSPTGGVLSQGGSTGGSAGESVSTTGGAGAGPGGAGAGGASGGATAGSGGKAQGGGGASAGTGGQSAGGMSAGGSGGAEKSAGCGAATWPTSKTYTMNVGGTSRTYILQIPDNYDTNHPYRLIFSFHWLNGTAENVANGSGTAKAYYGLADLSQGSTIFVAPQGINNGWSDSGRSNSQGGQDIDFTRALLTLFEDELCIDTTRVFAEGFSMGGSMSYAVACAMGDLFRGVAVHSGGPMSGCVQHDTPVAYFMTHGTQDSVCTYPGYGVPQVNDFAGINGCMPHDMPTPSGNTQSCIDFEGCMGDYPTRACIFIGDHTPSPPNVNSSWVPQETWNFISQF